MLKYTGLSLEKINTGARGVANNMVFRLPGYVSRDSIR